LLNDILKKPFLENIGTEYSKLKSDFANKKSGKQLLTYAESKENKIKIDWEKFVPVKPAFLGVKVFDSVPLQEIAGFIDWQPFFIAWEMHGKFPQLLSDEVIGEAATRLFADARALLKKSLMKNG
jgi:5-methyltetrahydrofolate--homocysteine methyltransferase